jgi:molecular chaperone DnaK
MAAFGIDFGTTTSCAVRLLAGRPQLFGDGEGNPLPSIVAVDVATGEARGGRDTWNKRFELQRHGNYQVIPSIKPFLGQDRRWPTNNGEWTATTAAAFVLRQLSDLARERLHEGITEATIAIPVGMSAAARRTLRQAAGEAGIEVTSFVAESTAAVFRYLDEIRHLHRVVVFDWGGGTLDISALELRSAGIFEIGLAGTPTAGNALDNEIAVFLHGLIMEGRGHVRGFDEMSPHDQNHLLFRAEEAKRQLSQTTDAAVSMTDYGGEPVHIRVDRRMLAPIVRPAVNEAVALLESTIHKAGLEVAAVDRILLIGGSSQLWLLREVLSADQRFMGRYRLAESPEWDVAHGAALLQSRPGSYSLAETFGLRLSDGSSVPLVQEGDAPSHEQRTLSLVLTEDAREAQIVIERIGAGTRAEPALTFSTQTLGFLQEEIALQFGLTSDLTFSAAAKSSRFANREPRAHEIEKVRFAYKLPAARP